ncbi:MAG: hypothetical protein MZV64_10145 [Ignavibacteriales bacterium]|nr:hypothetical protein [Ignavibacteriales bacterium]
MARETVISQSRQDGSASAGEGTARRLTSRIERSGPRPALGPCAAWARRCRCAGVKPGGSGSARSQPSGK